MAEALAGSPFHDRVEYYEALASTSDRVRELLDQLGPEAHFSVVLALEQTSGRGRLGRNWHSDQGKSLTLSVALWPSCGPEHFSAYPVAAALAVRETLKEFGQEASIKWPNDILLGGRKVCGILLEGRFSGESPRGFALGIGLNLGQRREEFPKELRDSATSLLIESGSMPSVELFAGALLPRLGVWLAMVESDSAEVFRSAQSAWAHRPGDLLRLDLGASQIQGCFVAIGGEGELLLETEDGTRALRHGEVVRVRPGGAS